MPTDTFQAQRDLYTNGSLTVNDYEFHPGVCVLPVCEDPPSVADPATNRAFSPVEVGRVHAPYRVRNYKNHSVKQQNPPVMPTPASVGSFVFLGGSLGVANGLNSTGQRFDWEAAAEYTFVENCVSRPADGLVLGSPPYSLISQFENLVAVGLPPQSQLVGAVASAGSDVKVGYQQAAAQAAAISSDDAWSYTTCSFFPGQLFDPNMANG